LDSIAVNDLCDSPDFVRRVRDRAARISLWGRVFRGENEARPTNVMEVFDCREAFEGVSVTPDPSDPPALAEARALLRAVSAPEGLPEGVRAEALFAAALKNVAGEGTPDEALRLRLLSFLRLALTEFPREARAAARLAGGLLDFPERDALLSLHARALATAAVGLLNADGDGAREADRFLARLLALKDLASAPDLSPTFVALSLRLGREEPPSWGPRPGFGAFGGALRTVMGLVIRLPDESLADLPVAAILKDPALKGLSLVELLKIKERLGIPPRSTGFRALRLANGVLEASIHMRDGGEAGRAAALAVIQDLDEDGVLECLRASGPGAPDPARLDTLAVRLGRAFGEAREEELVVLLLTLGAWREGAANAGFWSALPFSLMLPFGIRHQSAISGAFAEMAKGRLMGGDPLALFRYLLSCVLVRDCSGPPLLDYDLASRAVAHRSSALKAPERPRESAALAAAGSLAQVAAGPDWHDPDEDVDGGEDREVHDDDGEDDERDEKGPNVTDGARGKGDSEARVAAPWNPVRPFMNLAQLWAEPAGPFRRGGGGLEGFFYLVWAASLIASASDERLWPALYYAAALCPEDALATPFFTEIFIGPAFFDIILRTQKAGLHGAVRPALKAALAFPRTPELAGAAAALLRMEIFKSIAEETELDPEVAGLFEDLMKAKMDPGLREDLLDAMLVRLGVSGRTDAMEGLLLETASESMAAWEAVFKALAASEGAPSSPGGVAPGASATEDEALADGRVPESAAADARRAAGDLTAQAPDGLPPRPKGGPGDRATAIAAYFMAEAKEFRKAATFLFAACAFPGLLPAKKATAEAVIAGLCSQGAFEEATAVCDAFAALAESEGDPVAADGARMTLGEGMRGGGSREEK
jgi:hypothetical protein